MAGKRKVGVIGFGGIGQFLVKALLTDAVAKQSFELAFVWNRTAQRLREGEQLLGVAIPDECILEDLDDFNRFGCDVLVEVAHPMIYQTHGARFLAAADLFVGSPTALADGDLHERLHEQAAGGPHSLLLPGGALWGSMDIAKMGARCAIGSLTISMRKPATSFKLEEPLDGAVRAFLADHDVNECVLYDGPVRGICPLAPNNVNTMACLAIASGPELGFDRVQGKLIADKTIEAHIIEVELVGKPIPSRNGDCFRVQQRRYNPCDPNVVTATATYPSFLASLLACQIARGPGVHIV